MKYLFFFIGFSFVFAQVQDINYSTPKTGTVPFFKNDKEEIQNVVNNNSAILGELDDAIDLLHGGSIRTIQKSIANGITIDIFSLQSTNGSFSVDLNAVSDALNFSVSKKINITFSKGRINYWSIVSGPDGDNDFIVLFTDIDDGLGNIVGFKTSIQNISTTAAADLTLTLIIGGVKSPLIYTQF